jgi:hypothetical protein
MEEAFVYLATIARRGHSANAVVPVQEALCKRVHVVEDFEGLCGAVSANVVEISMRGV